MKYKAQPLILREALLRIVEEDVKRVIQVTKSNKWNQLLQRGNWDPMKNNKGIGQRSHIYKTWQDKRPTS